MPSLGVAYIRSWVFPVNYFFDCARSLYIMVDKVFYIIEGVFFVGGFLLPVRHDALCGLFCEL